MASYTANDSSFNPAPVPAPLSNPWGLPANHPAVLHMEDLQQRLRESERKNADLVQMVAREIHELKDALAEASAEQEKLRNHNAQMQGEISAMKSRDSRRSSQTSGTKRAAKLSEDLEEANENNAMLQNQLNAVNETRKRLQDELAAKEEELRQHMARADWTAVQAQYGQAQGQLHNGSVPLPPTPEDLVYGQHQGLGMHTQGSSPGGVDQVFSPGAQLGQGQSFGQQTDLFEGINLNTPADSNNAQGASPQSDVAMDQAPMDQSPGFQDYSADQDLAAPSGTQSNTQFVSDQDMQLDQDQGLQLGQNGDYGFDAEQDFQFAQGQNFNFHPDQAFYDALYAAETQPQNQQNGDGEGNGSASPYPDHLLE
ncbi:hypothetical protein GGS26DRAFT_598961 [Hypomontagnella submonticulosa]|nr:hypothetical protein GGS26DRAFT_598961 [Hypomontagnella submonticulosa]